MYKQYQLPYAYEALEPHIDALTMETHYSKHHAAYTKNLNDAAEKAGVAGREITELLAALGVEHFTHLATGDRRAAGKIAIPLHRPDGVTHLAQGLHEQHPTGHDRRHADEDPEGHAHAHEAGRQRSPEGQPGSRGTNGCAQSDGA